LFEAASQANARPGGTEIPSGRFIWSDQRYPVLGGIGVLRPLHLKADAMAELQPSEVLFIPRRRRLTHSRIKDETGQEILHLFYGEVELIFDEPDIAPLGEKLLEVERFRAEEAMAWSNAGPHDWERVRDLLQALIDQQILKPVAETSARTVDAYPARLGLAPEDRVPRAFNGNEPASCPMISKEAFGSAVELSNLEVLMPVYRTAHAALDTDGRQVGENNSTPRMLFLDLPTARKACNYPGSRNQDELPMNVTALKHMAKRWPELLSLSEQCRLALFERMPPRDPKALRAGELHFIAVTQLAAVGYVLVRGVDPVPNGQLDGGLAAMFRLIDGVRLVTNDLLRDLPGMAGCDTRVTAQLIADHAEHHTLYNGQWGVCAGPPALIDEYLRVLMGEEAAPIQAEPTVAERLGDLEAALDYGLLGQRVEATMRFLGASHGLLHQRLKAAFDALPADHTRSALEQSLDVPIDIQHYPMLRLAVNSSLVETFQREVEVSCWLFARAGEALPGKIDAGRLQDRVALDPAAQAAAARRLADFLATALPPEHALGEALRGEAAAVIADAYALERRCIRVAEREQGILNDRLRRAAGRPLTGLDVAAFNRPRFGPPLHVTLAAGLGLAIESEGAATVIRCGEHSITLAD
jgi:hypothetical protein